MIDVHRLVQHTLQVMWRWHGQMKVIILVCATCTLHHCSQKRSKSSDRVRQQRQRASTDCHAVACQYIVTVYFWYRPALLYRFHTVSVLNHSLCQAPNLWNKLPFETSCAPFLICRVQAYLALLVEYFLPDQQLPCKRNPLIISFPLSLPIHSCDGLVPSWRAALSKAQSCK